MRRIFDRVVPSAVRGRARLPALAPLAASIAVLAAAGPAGAASPWLKFENCPLNHTEPKLTACLWGATQGSTTRWEHPVPPSELSAGRVRVPLRRRIVLQGGKTSKNVFGAEVLVNPENGAPTLAPVAQTVPGGLKAMIDSSKLSGAALEAFTTISKNEETNKVHAVIESAPSFGPAILVAPENLLKGEGVGVDIPLKVRFVNSFLGEECYAGSDAQPIDAQLTSGTTSPPPPDEPISGQPGSIKGFDQGRFGGIAEDSLVNNTFEAPAMTGCGSEPAWQQEIDDAIDSRIGLPSPAGANSARIDGNFLLVGASAAKRELEALGVV